MGLRFCTSYKQSKSQNKWQSSTATGTKGNSQVIQGKTGQIRKLRKLPYFYKRNDINPVPDHF